MKDEKEVLENLEYMIIEYNKLNNAPEPDDDLIEYEGTTMPRIIALSVISGKLVTLKWMLEDA